MAVSRHSIVGFSTRFVIVLLFLISSTALIASANGYLFNPTTFEFEETGIAKYTVKPVPVTLEVNGKVKRYDRPDITVSHLLPGSYTVEIVKPGYHPWAKTFQLTQGQVVSNPFVVLFRDESMSKVATESQRLALLATAAQPVPTRGDLDIR